MIPGAFAQDLPGPDTEAKWGKIPSSQLLMTSYAADTTAAAVILSDVGEVSFSNNLFVVYDRHTRIKILSDAGYDWGTVSVTYYAKGGTQTVRNVKGQTFTINDKGDVTRHKMDKEAVFTENIDGSFERIRFTLPALEPGAVLEYSYRVVSEGPQYMPSWQFQRSEPVLWSEFKAEIPLVYAYTRKIVGTHPFAVESLEEITSREIKNLRWAMSDLPALREEAYMTTPNDYRAALDFQLSGYISNVGWTEYLTSWNELAGELMTLPQFGGQLAGSRDVKSQVETVTMAATTPREKMEQIYDFVSKSITWDQSDGVLVDQNISSVLKTGSGSRPEINLLLTAMLREAGLDAHPVLISTRSHGQPIEEYPLLSQFNSTLVAVEFPRDRILMDATNPMRPLNLLPTDALNRRGWLVKASKPSWIPIELKERYDHTIRIDGALNVDGSLTATLRSSSRGYAAVGNRRELVDAGSAGSFIINSMLEDLVDATIDSSYVANLDSVANDLHVTADFSAPTFAQSTGDFMFFTPVLIERFDENPLKPQERTFPVDTSFPISTSYTFRLQLPDEWAVDKDELPGTVLTRLPRDGGFFRREVQVEDDALIVKSVFALNNTYFEPHVYSELRTFFDTVVAAQNEQIIVIRTPD